MADTFKNFTSSLESPVTDMAEVVPSDAADLLNVSRALNVSGDGAVRVTTLGGSTATIHVAAGITFPVRVTRVWQTGTTATGIVAMW